MSYRVGEFGKPIYLATGFDMSGNSALTVVFTKPDGSMLQKPATAPNVAIGSMPANTYFEVTPEDGDIDQSGGWAAYGIYEDSTPRKLISETVQFTVNA